MDLRKFLDEEGVEKYNLLTKIQERHLAGNNYGPGVVEKENIFSVGFYPETARYFFQEWKNMKEGTVYIVNYPKTGNNWLHEITRYLVYMDDDEQLEMAKGMPSPMSMIDFSNVADKVDLMDQIPLKKHLFRTHLPVPSFDIAKVKKMKGKIIYIIRNPKDQAVSIYHFRRSKIFKYCGVPENWGDFLKEYVEGKHHCWTRDGEWYLDHLLDWWKYKDDKDFLFIHYEDMMKDIRKAIRRIAAFLNIKLTDEKLEEVIQYTSFQSMSGRMVKNWKIFTRKGQVGGWKDMFTVAQSEMMDEIVEKKLAGTGIKFTYQL